VTVSVDCARFRQPCRRGEGARPDRARRGARHPVVAASHGIPPAAPASAANATDTMLFPGRPDRALAVRAAIARLHADAGYDGTGNRGPCPAEGIPPVIRESGEPRGSGPGTVRRAVAHASAWPFASRRLDRRNDRSTIAVDARLTQPAFPSAPTGSRMTENRA
jgi:hypothetical protein